MIIKEYLNEGILIKHYSDSGFMLLQEDTGEKYAEAIDIVPCPHTYVETDELIDGDDNTEITGEEFFAMMKEVL